jgi:hypothetical protein
MRPRLLTLRQFALGIALLVMLSGCDQPVELTKAQLLEQTRHWKEPKVVQWWYAGSKEGMDYFYYRDLDVSKMFRVKSGQIELARTFPLTENRDRWMWMPWGPYAAGHD